MLHLKKAEYKELGFIEEHRTALFHYILEHALTKSTFQSNSEAKNTVRPEA